MPGAVAPHVLAVDLGTSGMKVALVDLDGRVTAWAEEPIATRIIPGGGAEQVPEHWWTALGVTSARLKASHPDEHAAVTTVCCSTQGEGTIALDEHGTPLTDCLLWMDMRGAPNLRRQHGGVPAVRGMSARRIATWIRLTGGAPSFTGKDPAAHMLWVRDELPEVYERTATFVNVLDYLDLRLTGRTVATVDSILTSWVTDNRDPRDIRYDDRLVEISGIDRDKLPEIVACTDVIGTLTPEAAERLGLRTSVQVVAGAIDTSAAAIGAGTTDNGRPHLYVGTSSWIAAHVAKKKTDLRHGLASVPCAMPDRYLLTALQSTAGGTFSWARENVLGQEDSLLESESAKQAAVSFFAASDVIVPSVPPGSNGVLWTPWLHGERAPVDDPDLRAGLLNVSLWNTRADMLRALYEGIALNTRWMFDPVASFLGSRPSSVTIVGGGARSNAWCQIFADVLDVEVRRPVDPVQVNARGAAWIGAVGTGQRTFRDLPALVATGDLFVPDRDNRAVYDDAFETFTDVAKRLGPVYRRLAKRRSAGVR